MLTSRLILLNFKRMFSESSGLLTVESLCNEDNRIKCINKMVTASRNTTIRLHPSVKVASVLIPIVKCDRQTDEPSLLFTLRSNKMRKHISQVSFPGGILEEKDESFIDCALRETEEEIGIGRDKITLWGQTSLVHLRTAPAIMPVIGMINDYSDHLLKINSQEVERVFTVPVTELCRRKQHTQFRMIPRNTSHNSMNSTSLAAYSLPVFTIDDARVWGITAIITHLFLQSILPEHIYDKKIPYISKYK